MIKRQLWILVATPLVLLTLPDSVFAYESMRCGRHIITSGQRHGPDQYEILKKCGEPTSRSGYTWTYEQPGRAPRVIVFDHNGRVSRIDRLSKMGR